MILATADHREISPYGAVYYICDGCFKYHDVVDLESLIGEDDE